MNEPLNACEDLVSLLHAICDVYPDKPAVTVRHRVGVSVTHSYYELAADSFALAATLCHMGLAGKHIAVACDNRYEGLVALFGVACAGGVAVLTDAQRGKEEIYHMLLRADAVACFLSPMISEMAGFTGKVSLFRLEGEANPITFEEMLEQGHQLLENGKQHVAQVKPGDVAVITFNRTPDEESPAIQLTHGGLLANAKAAAAAFPPATKVFTPLPLIHAYGLTASALVTFLRGGELGLARGPESLPYGMHSFGASLLVCATYTVTELAQRLRSAAQRAGIPEDPTGRGWWARLRRKNIAERYLGVKKILYDNLTHIVCGSAPVAAEDLLLLENRFGIEVLKCYAMVECSPLVSVADVKDNEPGTVGHILPCHEVKFDETGHILVRGQCVTPGYYGNPGQVKEVLDAEGWFNTGDTGYLDDKGRLVVHEQVIVE